MTEEQKNNDGLKREYLKVRTRGNASPQRKPRVYFTCRPEDTKAHITFAADRELPEAMKKRMLCIAARGYGNNSAPGTDSAIRIFILCR